MRRRGEKKKSENQFEHCYMQNQDDAVSNTTSIVNLDSRIQCDLRWPFWANQIPGDWSEAACGTDQPLRATPVATVACRCGACNGTPPTHFITTSHTQSGFNLIDHCNGVQGNISPLCWFQEGVGPRPNWPNSGWITTTESASMNITTFHWEQMTILIEKKKE